MLCDCLTLSVLLAIWGSWIHDDNDKNQLQKELNTILHNLFTVVSHAAYYFRFATASVTRKAPPYTVAQTSRQSLTSKMHLYPLNHC